MTQTYYIAAGFLWTPGDIVTNETFSTAPHKSFFLPEIPLEWASNDDYLARRKAESRLEEYRRIAHSPLPSRRNAIFLNKKEADARKWLLRETRREYCIYELTTVLVKNSCEANYVWYNYCVRLHKNPYEENRKLFSNEAAREIAGCLKAYWENCPTEKYKCPTETEILFVGKLKVLQRLQ